MNICIVGLGLLGGSFALGIKSKHPEYHFIGVDVSEDNQKKAFESELIDEITTLKEGVKRADFVVLAVPVDGIIEMIPETLDLLPETSVLVDFGSTKELICHTADRHKKRNQFVAAHPIAGTEFSGPKAAFKELLPGKEMIICDAHLSHQDAMTRALQMFRDDLNMPISYMDSKEHDRHIAYVSHLSHISSFALSTTVLEKEKDEASIFEMAGSGFSSTVRLAKSSPSMWAPIFSQNRKNVSEALGAYIEYLQKFKKIVDSDDYQASYEWMHKANDIKRILKDIDK